MNTTYRIRATKIMSPTICQKLRAGFAKLKSSTITPFHRYLPTNAIITSATMNARNVAANSTYASRRASEDWSPTNPSTVAFAAACTILPAAIGSKGGRGKRLERGV